jgi:3-hydroxymyristoyl/3-hydroxydecanoyl-(acyl carrier protein) dehydratase/1-acyl-sn-glycerol-3-phosphate acyltransferase
MQTMQPAPQLSPILSSLESSERAQLPPAIPAAVIQAALEAPVVSAPAIAAAPIAAAPATIEDPLLAAYREQIIALGQSEQAHIAQQTTLHQRFLAVQDQAMHLLAQSPAGTVSAPLLTPVLAQPATPAPAVVPPSAPAPVMTPVPAPAAKAPTPPAAQNPILIAIPTKPVAPAEPASPTGALVPNGPTFDRAQLEIHASGLISEIFGEAFAVQDNFHRQVRMPEPPLLLADRVTGLDAEAGSMGKGVIWSESDVLADSWYLHQGHIPAGIMIESGQADLMLISWLGVDFTNQNDRVYRLLGCELTYHGGLPKVGDTLAHEIHMDGHATQGDVRLMFFHSDCRVGDEVRLSVSKGQAGFFTEAELADSDGCLWTPEEQELTENPRLDAPAVECTKTAFDAADLQAFADGRPWDCFGPGYDRAKTHTRSPRIANGPMMLLGPITDFDTQGGPWGRGYMKSTVAVQPDSWFFDGHFKNDPCMPGTLMFDGCLQAMAVYMTALGFTINRDGWRFEPANDLPFQLSCRGQVTPRSKVLTYEIFVEEVHDGPIPTLYADILCTVDGLKAFHARRVALQLTPSWPLDAGSALLEGYVEPKPVAKAGDFPFDYRSLIACANGRPSEAFGPIYDRFDGPGRVARLPNPPYHFLSRVTRTQGEVGSMAKGMEVDVEYDIPVDAWYFDENGCRAMPFAVLLEAALQPCGWLASYLGCALTTDMELCFRNLDGKGTLHVDLLPDSGTLLTRVKSTGISRTASMIIVNFQVECSIGDTLVYELETVFGFFPQAALENQIGLATTDEQRAVLEAPANHEIDLTRRPNGLWEADRPRLAEPMLLMMDRIGYFDPTGGAAGLGVARGEKDVDMGEWFFKAHFFQDPVQPGSLGIEAMVQLLQWTMLEKGLDEGIENPRFETLGLGEEMSWKYRGQVVPDNKLISSTVEITEIREEDGSVIAVADASLWVDGKRIYEASGLGMRIVSGGTPDTPSFELDPESDTWLKDHCPTWTKPALPMMSMVDLLAQGACSVDPVTTLRDIRVKGWLVFDGPRSLRTRRKGEHVRLLAVDEEGIETEVATARVLTGCYGPRPDALPALKAEPMALPYETGELFHGPAFQVLESLVRTEKGASSVLHTQSEVPTGRLNPVLLDGATHGIPHDQLHQWFAELSSDKVAYPALIPEMHFYGPTPTTGTIRCEVRPDGTMGSIDYPAFQVQLIDKNGVWCSFRLIESCFDKGSIGQVSPMDRQAFLRDRAFVPGVHTSTQTDGITRLTEADLARIDWLPGTVADIYGSRDISEIAIKEHIAAANGIHPGIAPAGLPLQSFDLKTERNGDTVTVSGDGRGTQNLTPVVDFWSKWFDRDPWLVEDLYYGLIERFVGKVVLTDPDAFAAVRGKSLIYLGNHQVGVESLLFSVIASGLGQVPTVTLAKAEHRHTWLGKLIAHCFDYPNVEDPQVIAFFDREDKASLPAILGKLAQEMAGPGRSIMVHVEGTRSLDCTTPVQKMSGAFLDMALTVNAPVVPIRFVGGLPREAIDKRIEFPIGMGKQDIYIGKPILPEELAGLHYGDRKKQVIQAINALGPSHSTEQPCAGDAEFAARVRAWQESHNVSEEHAVLGCILSERNSPVKETTLLLNAETALPEGPTAPWLAELRRRILGG